MSTDSGLSINVHQSIDIRISHHRGPYPRLLISSGSEAAKYLAKSIRATKEQCKKSQCVESYVVIEAIRGEFLGEGLGG